MGKITQLIILGLTVMIKIYRYCLSPLMGTACRFHPSCSNYALDALNHHGLWRGCYLILTRLARCHPGCQGGVDPVPE